MTNPTDESDEVATTWQPPRGRGFRCVVWVILISLGLCLLLSIVVLVVAVVGSTG